MCQKGMSLLGRLNYSHVGTWHLNIQDHHPELTIICLSPPEVVESGLQDVLRWQTGRYILNHLKTKTVIARPSTYIFMWTVQSSHEENALLPSVKSFVYLSAQCDLQAWGLGTSEVKSVCRYNSSGVQISNEMWSNNPCGETWTTHQHVNTDQIPDPNLPPMLCDSEMTLNYLNKSNKFSP